MRLPPLAKNVVPGSPALLIGCGLVLLAVAARLLPHPPNFTPLAACAMFSGFLFRGRAAFLVPIAAMLASDLVVGLYDPRLMALVYGSLVLPTVLGRLVGRDGIRWHAVGAFSLAGSILFFLITNFGVWAFSGGYPRTGAGLAACYAAALPFFKYTIAGDLCWCGALFGGYAMLMRLRSSASVLPARA